MVGSEHVRGMPSDEGSQGSDRAGSLGFAGTLGRLERGKKRGSAARAAGLRELAELIQAVESDGWKTRRDDASSSSGSSTSSFASSLVTTGWEAVDQVLAPRLESGRGPDGGTARGRPVVAGDTAGDIAGDTDGDALDRPADGGPDAAFAGGLACGALHEWFGLGSPGGPPRSERTASDAADDHVARQHARTRSRGSSTPSPFRSDRNEPLRRWVPPLAVLVHLARQTLRHDDDREETGHVAWIGRRIWPYPQTLLAAAGPPSNNHAKNQAPSASSPDLVRRSLFIDPPGDAERLWAVDLALRCPAFAAVIADGVGLAMSQSRRLQLAAASGRALGLLVRPPGEWDTLSAAATRWWVGVQATGDARSTRGPSWSLTLWRCKGRQRQSDHGRAVDLPRSWVLEQDRAQGTLRLAADVADRSDQTPAATALIEPNRRTA